MIHKKFIFLDRDGVINKKLENDYIKDWSEFEFLPGVLEILRYFKQNGIFPIIITNQQCVGKGLISIGGLENIHAKMVEEIEKNEGWIADIFICPHLASDHCDCRKPKPGLILQAREKYHIDLSQTYFVGDSVTDVSAGKSAGTKTILINNQKLSDLNPDYFCSSLFDTIKYVLK